VGAGTEELALGRAVEIAGGRATLGGVRAVGDEMTIRRGRLGRLEQEGVVSLVALIRLLLRLARRRIRLDATALSPDQSQLF
jgi:hypothetical protein